MACFLRRLSHLDMDSFRGITSLALISGSDKFSRNLHLSYTNQAGLPGCTFLQYLNVVSKCFGITLELIDTLRDQLGSSLKVRVLG